jgi:hypothetical protein
VWVLRCVGEAKAETTLISLWEFWDAIRAFAGPQYVDAAVYYPEDRNS